MSIYWFQKLYVLERALQAVFVRLVVLFQSLKSVFSGDWNRIMDANLADRLVTIYRLHTLSITLERKSNANRELNSAHNIIVVAIASYCCYYDFFIGEQ